jgi:hypothetical protein
LTRSAITLIIVKYKVVNCPEVGTMAGLRERGEIIRQFILENVEKHPGDIVTFTSEAQGISRQAVNKHIQHLVAQEMLVASGTTRNRSYQLKTIATENFVYSLQGLQEDVVWRNHIAPLFIDHPKNVREIWYYGFTEMLNNAIDHSSGGRVGVTVDKTVVWCSVSIHDDGEGIFKKIQRELKLDDERHAILELAKGKLTTDPSRHTGEGIFFSSKIFDVFSIYSGKVLFLRLPVPDVQDESVAWILEKPPLQKGTAVTMQLRNGSTKTTQEIFGRFADDEDGFVETIVPVHLAQYGDEQLISRSQAKRLLARCDRFKRVVLNFKDVESIGQAFADEVFRVFVQAHPDILIAEINANPAVKQMISRARHHE